MAKLYFRYGAMGSSKTLNLLAVAHTYRQQGKEVLLLKPSLDLRFGASSIRSRAGLEKTADVLLDADSDVTKLNFEGISCLLVDEAQFLLPSQVEQLRRVTLDNDLPVICYGLRTDFRSRLFPGSQRLMELADSIEEIKMTCTYCQKKATFNPRFVNGKATLEGAVVEVGAEEKYLAVCARCFAELIGADVDPSLWSVAVQAEPAVR